MRTARTAIFWPATWIAPRGSSRNVRYQPVGFTLQDLTKARPSSTTTQLPMKRCLFVPALMRRTLPCRSKVKTSSGNCSFAFICGRFSVEHASFGPSSQPSSAGVVLVDGISCANPIDWPLEEGTMQNAHERFGTLEFTKRLRATITQVRVHVDRAILETARDGRSPAAAHLISMVA